jgi:ornithine--oxo-acid transaminase
LNAKSFPIPPPAPRSGFGPYTPGWEIVPYNDAAALEQALKDPHVCGFLVEPVQGEAGVIVPDKGYMAAASRLCKENNVLLIADEIQCGLGRTGKLVTVEHDDVRPDVLILAKALSGGVYPVSVVLADDDVMLCIRPGQHGSTYGGNPVGAKVATAALQVLVDEGLVGNSDVMGERLREGLRAIQADHPAIVQEVRGLGLMTGMEIREDSPKSAYQLCMELSEMGMLCKPTHEHIIRLTPPLCITAAQIDQALGKISTVISGNVH